jgi:hypothetical protein
MSTTLQTQLAALAECPTRIDSIEERLDVLVQGMAYLRMFNARISNEVLELLPTKALKEALEEAVTECVDERMSSAISDAISDHCSDSEHYDRSSIWDIAAESAMASARDACSDFESKLREKLEECLDNVDDKLYDFAEEWKGQLVALDERITDLTDRFDGWHQFSVMEAETPRHTPFTKKLALRRQRKGRK